MVSADRTCGWSWNVQSSISGHTSFLSEISPCCLITSYNIDEQIHDGYVICLCLDESSYRHSNDVKREKRLQLVDICMIKKINHRDVHDVEGGGLHEWNLELGNINITQYCDSIYLLFLTCVWSSIECHSDAS